MKILSLFIPLLTLQVCSGTTYFVATNGNNANIGSSISPWKTIGKSVSVAVAGDIVNIGQGVYNEFITNSTSGTAANPIRFIGARDSLGRWLTVVDPSFTVTNAWVSAPEIGSGIWKQTNMPFATREMRITGKHVGYVNTNGNMSADISNGYLTNWVTGFEVMLQPTGATVTNTGNFLSQPFWDGIEALYCSTGNVTYLRLRDGSNPSSLSIKCAPNHPLKTYMDVIRPAWDLLGQSFIVLSNLNISGGFCGIRLSTGTHNITLSSNYFDNGWNNIYVIGGSWSNNIVNNTFSYDWYGGSCGAWETSTGQTYRVRASSYICTKHLMGSGSSAQRHIYLLGCGSNIVVSGNSITGGGGNGMNIVGVTVVPGILVYSNSFSKSSSAGLFIGKNHVGTLIYGNAFSDSNANIRTEIDESGTISTTVYVYRNTFWLPDNIGDQTYWFINSTLAYHPTNWYYHNSFSGGQGHIFVSSNTGSAGGLTNLFVLNNIFSDGVYVTGSSSWLTTTKIGGWDYNLSTPPNISNPTWFGGNNIKATTNIWTSAEGMDFKLPIGSQAISVALDTSSTFTLNGRSFSALPDTATLLESAWDMGAYEFVPVSVVTNLQVVSSYAIPPKTAGVDLSWGYDFAGNPSVTNLILAYGTAPNLNCSNFFVGLSTNASVVALARKLTYYFAIATKANGVQGPWSSIVSVKTPRN